MRATLMYGAFDVRVEDVPDPKLLEQTDALVAVKHAGVCGSDLWPYKTMEPTESGRRMGHEFIGVVQDVGADVSTMKPGDLVVSPFLWCDGTCVFCRNGLHSSCVNSGRYGFDHVDGGQGEAVRVPRADGTLVVLPVDVDDRRIPSLLTLTDVMCTGHHAARAARVAPGNTVAVVGDGAVGLCGVIASKRLGAAQIILLGRHPERIALAKEFGASDIVSERGEEAVERVRELTDGFGVELRARVRWCSAGRRHRDGDRSSREGSRPCSGCPRRTGPTGLSFWKNVSVGGGPAPARAYIEELMADVLDETIEPGRVFDRVTDLDGVPDGYRAMNDREAVKVRITF